MLDDITIPAEFFEMNFIVMTLSALALAPFIWMHRNVGRLWGSVFVATYVAYVAVVLTPSSV